MFDHIQVSEMSCINSFLFLAFSLTDDINIDRDMMISSRDTRTVCIFLRVGVGGKTESLTPCGVRKFLIHTESDR